MKIIRNVEKETITKVLNKTKTMKKKTEMMAWMKTMTVTMMTMMRMRMMMMNRLETIWQYDI